MSSKVKTATERKRAQRRRDREAYGGRSREAVENTLSALGAVNEGKPWTPEDDHLLDVLMHFPINRSGTAEHLGRSIEAVAHRVKKLRKAQKLKT